MIWTEILRAARDLSDQILSEGSIAWFRGHSDVSYSLKSTLYRYVERLSRDFRTPPDDNERKELLRDEYKTLYRRFKADAWPLLEAPARSEWGVIFAMQHYGLPTRLLDWTESFACAVFFAQLDRNPTQDAAVWVLDPHALNALAVGHAGLVALDDDTSSESTINSRHWHPKWVPPTSTLASVAASPIFTNPRMTAQRSAFTVSGDSFLPLDEEFEELSRRGRLRKLVLPASTFEDANSFLSMAGVTAFTFYPDLQGLAMRHKTQTEQKIKDVKRWYPQFFK